ncbi:MAG: 2-amino-4-hydroxy-6-hydroxymethyldihydropteridine diphosphokinase [Thermaerobacter sp.]|nr:2-amino-4-hydroxy-6-hydroxymethyldihydropteridine diphosphokinase [Thermaerobacter sp.]
MTEAAVGLGANLGDRLRTLRAGLFGVGLPILAVSSLYESAPVETDPLQPRYLNAVAILDVPAEMGPEAMLSRLLQVEAVHGRVRRGAGKAPRTLDLDLLLFGTEQVDTPKLQLPHPGVARRRFVLEPLLEVRPQARLADGSPLLDRLAECRDQDVQQVEGRCWWWRISN